MACLNCYAWPNGVVHVLQGLDKDAFTDLAISASQFFGGNLMLENLSQMMSNLVIQLEQSAVHGYIASIE